MRHNPSRPSVRVLAAIGVVALALSACGGGDDDDAAPTTPTTATTVESNDDTSVTTAPAAADTTPGTTADTMTAATTVVAAPSTDDGEDADGGDEDDDVIIVDDVSDLPPDCVDLLADFLKLIEPAVSEIDWTNATLGDFQTISDQLESEFEAMTAREIEVGCDNYDLSSDQAAMQAAIDIAEEEAPGAVGWLEFVASLSAEPTAGADAPQDCDGAIAYIDGLIAQGATMTNVPFGEVNRITQAIDVITTDCAPEQADEFLTREDVAVFMD